MFTGNAHAERHSDANAAPHFVTVAGETFREGEEGGPLNNECAELRSSVEEPLK